MERIRKRYPPSFKAKVALEAIKEHKTSAELASLYQVHPGQIRNWKAVVLKSLVELFSDRRKGKEQDNEQLIAGFRIPTGQRRAVCSHSRAFDAPEWSPGNRTAP